MVGLMMAGIALTFQRHPAWGAVLMAVAVAVKATAVLAFRSWWVWMRQLRDRRGIRCGRSWWPQRRLR